MPFFVLQRFGGIGAVKWLTTSNYCSATTGSNLLEFTCGRLLEFETSFFEPCVTLRLPEALRVPEWALPQKAARMQPVVALELGGFNFCTRMSLRACLKLDVKLQIPNSR
jgi:hypothetical protein